MRDPCGRGAHTRAYIHLVHPTKATFAVTTTGCSIFGDKLFRKTEKVLLTFLWSSMFVSRFNSGKNSVSRSNVVIMLIYKITKSKYLTLRESLSCDY